FTNAAQVMPSIGSSTSAADESGRVAMTAFILPGSIPAGSSRTMTPMATDVRRGPLVAASVAGPWGPIHVAATSRGIVAIDILAPREVFVSELERRLRVPVEIIDGGRTSAARHLRQGEAAVRGFVAGDPDAFANLVLDLGDRPAWDRAVLGAVRQIPWGSTSSYGG